MNKGDQMKIEGKIARQMTARVVPEYRRTRCEKLKISYMRVPFKISFNTHLVWAMIELRKEVAVSKTIYGFNLKAANRHLTAYR